MSEDVQPETPASESPAEFDGAPIEVYANIVEMNLGPYDFTMDFGFQSPEHRRDRESGDRNVVGTKLVRISMSHAHAKSMIPILARLVANLETNAGTIPTPGFDDLAKE